MMLWDSAAFRHWRVFACVASRKTYSCTCSSGRTIGTAMGKQRPRFHSSCHHRNTDTQTHTQTYAFQKCFLMTALI